MSSQRTVSITPDARTIALGEAILTDLECVCGQRAHRVTIERDPAPLVKGKRRWTSQGTFADTGVNVRTWCGDTGEDHTGGQSTYGPAYDPDSVAVTEEDL